MYILLSGEGPTDIGAAKDDSSVCEGEAFLPGPMAVIVDQVVDEAQVYFTHSYVAPVTDDAVAITATRRSTRSICRIRWAGSRRRGAGS